MFDLMRSNRKSLAAVSGRRTVAGEEDAEGTRSQSRALVGGAGRKGGFGARARTGTGPARYRSGSSAASAFGSGGGGFGGYGGLPFGGFNIGPISPGV